MTFFYEDKKTITLNSNSKFASGGEGTIYMHPTDKRKCIKIYHTPKNGNLIDSYKTLSNLGDNFIKPEKMLFNSKGDLCGFEMKYIDLNQFHILKKLTTKSFCDQNNFDRKFKYNVYLALKKAIEEAHSKNIIIGDLNPYNILFNSKCEVLFVDVDSFATKDKPHSGVLLEDIRDWFLHPNINQKTDAFAFDVLVYWMFTYLHPYRGTTKLYKNLEERVLKNASVLHDIPDLITPPVYEKFSNIDIINQFKEVFQGKRFLVDLQHLGQIPQNVPAFQPLNLNSSDLYIRLMYENVLKVDASSGLMVLKMKGGEYKVMNVNNYGVYSELETLLADDVFVGNSKYIVKKGNQLFHNNKPLKNGQTPSNTQHISVNNTLFVLDKNLNLAWKYAIDNIINDNVQFDKMEMYAPSVQFLDSILYFVGDNYWLFLPNGISHNTIKSDLKIKNAYYKNGVFCIEHIVNGKINYGLYKIINNKLEFLYELQDFVKFDVKGDYVFIPQNKKIDLLFIPKKEIVMTIDCPVCNLDSQIYQTNSGMVIFDSNKVFLVNKK